MGFDFTCIPNIESLPWEHFCTVCRLLVNPNETLQSMCGHLYCKPCLAYVASTTRVCPYDGYLVTDQDAKPLAESNKALADTIGKTVVKCLYQNSGCTWQGSLSHSSSHLSKCAFGSSLVICYLCGTQVAHRHGQDHLRVCPVMQQVQMQAYIQASMYVAISQASAQGHGVAAATLTQYQWYQQQYQQYYQNYTGYFMHQQPFHLPSSAPQNASQNQVLSYIQPGAQYVPQNHPQTQGQPQLQSQSLVLHQPHVVVPSASHLGTASQPQAYPSVPPHPQPQAYPSVPSHPQHPSQTFPASQGLQGVQPQAHSQTKLLSQAHHLTNSKVPQHHQFHGKIQNPMHHQTTVQNTLPQNTIGQCQSNQPHAYSTGQKIYTQPNQKNQVGAPPNNMPMYHQVGTQTPQVQNHFSQQVPHVLPPESHESLRRAHTKQLLLKYGRAPVPESSDMHLSNKPLAMPSVPQQHTPAPTTDVVHNQVHQGGPSYNPHIAPQSHLTPIELVQGLQKHPQALQVHQLNTPILGLKSQMSHHSATVSRVGSGQAAPSLPIVKEADMQRTQSQVPQAPWNQDKVRKQGDRASMDGTKAKLTSDLTNAVHGEKRAVEVTASKLDYELKGKRIDESVHRSNIVMEGNKRKTGSLGKQVMEENVGYGRSNPGKNLLVEKKGTEDDTSLLNHIGQDGLRHLKIVLQHYLKTAHLDSENVEKSRASSSRSLDTGFDQKLLVRPHEMDEPDFKLRSASRFSQPFTELGERQFRREHLGMPSHGSGPLHHGLGGSREETTDTEGRYRLGLLRSDFKGHGNLQREKVQDADIIGPVKNNGLRPGDVGLRSSFTLQGFSGDGGSFPGGLGSVSNSRKRAMAPVECTGLHSQTKNHQQKSVAMGVVIKQNAKKLKIAPAASSPFCNQNKNEERRFGGLG